MKQLLNYIIITPVQNEERYIRETIKSVLCQTIKPIEWVIVNDGSKDETGNIIREYETKHHWIRTIDRKGRGFRSPGVGVIEAFYDGYNSLNSHDWDFIVKLDGDLSFDSDYFEGCFEKFIRNPKLGIAGGMIYHSVKGTFQVEENPSFHVRGATKIYRKECWNAIGRLIKVPGWDTLDEVKASMLGWETRSFSDLKVIHHRFTGGADGIWRNWVKNGRANYISGYHPLFMALKCIKRVFQKPYVISTIALAYGFISGYLKRIDQIDDKQLINYLRQQQIRKLTLRNSIWK